MDENMPSNDSQFARIAASFVILMLVSAFLGTAWAGGAPAAEAHSVFPPALDSYQDSGLWSVSAILFHRIKQEPFNLVATLIFVCAIIHTFMASKFMAISHAREHAHEEKIRRREARENSKDMPAGVYHLLGEVSGVKELGPVA